MQVFDQGIHASHDHVVFSHMAHRVAFLAITWLIDLTTTTTVT